MTSKLETLEFIENCFGEYQVSNAGLNVSVVCPICKEKKGTLYDKKKLVIRTTDFALHCWVCGYKSRSLYWILFKYKKSFLKEYIEKFQTKKIDFNFSSGFSFLEKIQTTVSGKHFSKEKSSFMMPKNISLVLKVPENKKYLWLHKKAKEYLFKKRKLTEQQIWDNNLSICYNFSDKKEKFFLENRIIFPSINHYLEFDFYTARLFIETAGKSKYINSSIAKEIVFNSGFIDLNFKEITLVEGPFDYICSPYKNTIPILGSSFERSSKLFEWLFSFKPDVIRIALDKDEIKKREVIAQNLSVLRDFGTRIIVSNITHPVAKDFAELQELGLFNEKIDFVEEFVWYPKTKKERIIEKLT
jgi:hypothetical protein